MFLNAFLTLYWYQIRAQLPTLRQSLGAVRWVQCDVSFYVTATVKVRSSEFDETFPCLATNSPSLHLCDGPSILVNAWCDDNIIISRMISLPKEGLA